MNISKKYLGLALALTLVVFSCTNGFDEINTNGNGPETVPANLYIPSILERTSDRLLNLFVGGDMGATWAQQWSKVQYNDEERYILRADAVQAIWDDLYAGSLMDTQIMGERAIAEGNDNLLAISLTMKAFGYQVLTDMYGAIPMSQALKAREGINSPKYDSQEEVYTNIKNLLDSANNLYGANAGIIDGTSDIMYEGDYAKWQKFNNSLLFRVLMRESSVVNNNTELQALMSQPMFTSNSEEAKIIYLETDPNANPIWSTIVNGNRGEWKVGEEMVNYLEGQNDPRLEILVGLNADDEYRGKPAGIKLLPNDDYNFDNVSPLGEFYLKPTLPGYFMSYAELKLLQAEAAQRGLITGNTNELFAEGIKAHMQANGVAASAYTPYIDRVSQGSISLEQIFTQKWVVLFGQGVEAWTEWRRSTNFSTKGYPSLDPAIEGALTQIPYRYTYPSNEQSQNNANWRNAVNEYYGGKDLLISKVWWMQ